MISRIALVACAFLVLFPFAGCQEDNPYYRAKGRVDTGVLDATAPQGDAPTAETQRQDGPPRTDTSGDLAGDSQPILDAGRDRNEDQSNAQKDALTDLPPDGSRVDLAPGDALTDTQRTDVPAAETGRLDTALDTTGTPPTTDTKPSDSLPPDTAIPPIDGGQDGAATDAGSCAEGTSRACGSTTYPATSACRAGTQTCVQGAWGPCTGAIPPLGTEACNAVDDTCDGTTDENLPQTTCGIGACMVTVNACNAGSYQACVPGTPISATDATCDGVDDNCNGLVDEGCAACVYVAPTGDDDSGDGSAQAPYLTIQEGIKRASGGNGVPKRVCVAMGATCADTPASYDGPFEIPQGIAVQGAFESTTWSLCPSTTPGPTLVTKEAAGITFTAVSALASAATELSRFTIQREASASAQTLVGVTVDKLAGVVLSNLAIVDEPAVNSTYAVSITGGASVEILRSRLMAGNGTIEATAVRVAGGKVTLRENCDTVDDEGRCATECDAGTLGLWGRKTKSSQAASSTYGLWLKDAAGSSVQANTVCGGQAEQSAAIHLGGTAAKVTIRGNVVQNDGGDTSAQAIRLVACEGASPSIAANTRIGAKATTNTAGVDAIQSSGNCHPVIDGNGLIEASSTVGGVVNAIHCSNASRCAILDNDAIKAQASLIDAQVVGVRCTGESACARVDGNQIEVPAGKELFGIYVSKNETTVANNQITCGCATGAATGAWLGMGSRATLAKNTIIARECESADAAAAKYRGVQIAHDGSRNEPVLDENDIQPVGLFTHSCSSAAVELSSTQTDTGAVGVFTNNTFFPGACTPAFGFIEASELHARVVKNNRFVPVSETLPNLYSRAGASVGGIDAVNALGGGTSSSGNTTQ